MFVNAAEIVLEKRTGFIAHDPGKFGAAFGRSEIAGGKFCVTQAEVTSQPGNIFFAQRWGNMAAAVGAGCAIDFLPNFCVQFENNLVYLF